MILEIDGLEIETTDRIATLFSQGFILCGLASGLRGFGEWLTWVFRRKANVF